MCKTKYLHKTIGYEAEIFINEAAALKAVGEKTPKEMLNIQTLDGLI